MAGDRAKRGDRDAPHGGAAPREGNADRTFRTSTKAGAGQRALRVGERIRHALSELLQRGDIAEPILTARPVTIPEVRLTPDLRLATVYVLPQGGEEMDEVIRALERSKRYIRRHVAGAINLKFAPELRFAADQSYAEAQRIEALLASERVRRDLRR
jgi:ribosome-binding factor A